MPRNADLDYCHIAIVDLELGAVRIWIDEGEVRMDVSGSPAYMTGPEARDVAVKLCAAACALEQLALDAEKAIAESDAGGFMPM